MFPSPIPALPFLTDGMLGTFLSSFLTKFENHLSLRELFWPTVRLALFCQVYLSKVQRDSEGRQGSQNLSVASWFSNFVKKLDKKVPRIPSVKKVSARHREGDMELALATIHCPHSLQSCDCSTHNELQWAFWAQLWSYSRFGVVFFYK